MCQLDRFKVYSLDDHFVLFDNDYEYIHLLNSTAHSIWTAWQAGFKPGEIAEGMVALYPASTMLTLKGIEKTIESWENPQTELSHSPQTVDKPIWVSPPAPKVTRYYQYFDGCAAVNFCSEHLASLIHPIFANMSLDVCPVPDVVFDLYTEKNGYSLSVDHRLICQNTSENDIVVKAAHEMIARAYRSPESLIILHAGAVMRSGRAMLLAGKGGSGKTTLAAGLLHNGFYHVSDDVSPVLNANQEIMPLPVALGVKQGSWPALKKDYPEIESLPEYHRFGKRVRYLPPGSAVVERPYRTYPVSHIVFPCYSDGAKTTFTTMTSAQVLAQIIEAGSILGQKFESPKLESFLSWIRSVKGVSIHYSALDEAIPIIRKCFDGH